ncbi:MAG: hypothetical protein IJS81_07215 [Selenomonadaceae bacterium]|nr:hypothetical protein [Selenomonadaceae bacterium]
MEREYVEWTNGWREDSNTPLKRRWLLTGDSVAREWRGRLQDMVRMINISVDFFATSLNIDDPAFFRELRNFLSYDEYKYEIVLINWGSHHAKRCSDNQDMYFSYKMHYENLLNYVKDTAFLNKGRGGGQSS